ncbi:MAG: protein kinase domain-containing protein, partial [Candidatus Zixiibacteriota bacterium]
MLTKDSKVNHYSILEKIGQGGMGEVFLAHDSKLDRKVALKFLSEELGKSEQFRKRFTKEAQSAAKLNHPNIVTVHEVGEFDNRPFIAMTFVSG